MRTIFVIDDEENIRFIISEYLIREGFKVETFSSIGSVQARLHSAVPDMFILDLALPERESLEFVGDITSRTGLPVMLMKNPGEEIDPDPGWELDSDHYLSKPFNPRELVGRVRSVFRRSPLPVIPEKIMETGNLRIDPNNRHIVVDNREVMLTPMEYELLLLLIQQPQRTFNRQELLDRVWGCDYIGDIRAVDDLVKRLRKKLRESGSTKNVKTVWGYGYRFDD